MKKSNSKYTSRFTHKHSQKNRSKDSQEVNITYEHTIRHELSGFHDSNNKSPAEQDNQLDYDKLAEAIVKAQRIAEEEDSKPIEYGLIKNKNYRILLMNFFNIFVYFIAFWASAVALFYIIFMCSFPIISMITLVLVLLFFVIFFFACFIEAWNEKDSDTIQHFDSSVAWIGLIIALISLFYNN